jgi:hypothetical protein
MLGFIFRVIKGILHFVWEIITFVLFSTIGLFAGLLEKKW